VDIEEQTDCKANDERCLVFKNGIFVGDVQSVSSKRRKINGFGTFSYASSRDSLNGKIYRGNFVNGERSGFGTMLRNDIVLYRGFWSKDKKHGMGEAFEADGILVYQGQWKHGMKHAERRLL
jgi:hypothetical protein